ncbi:hypothetical protein MSAN_01649500 [Mycena sanguinolenta]|uniref:Uncharacterized protein n=1 Tax=Mycena sanguinolenta TaxID=230812 RepID=A0A8H7CUF5_9AGAR|nr:hypothetical protein MSAN_01649500 [Mycena sanguinolenta]
MRRVGLPTGSVSKLRPRAMKPRKWWPRWRRDNLTHTMRQVDLFHQWDIPLEAYKHIGPGPRFSVVEPDWRLAGNFGEPLPWHPRPESIPSPPFSATAAPASSKSALNRSLVIKGLMQPNPSRFLMRIHEGPLEFARLEPEDLIHSPFPLSFLPRSYSLTLSFLSSHSARAFVHTHLSVPASLYEFSRSPNPTWQWLFPPPPLPQPVAAALRKYTARRAVSVSWFDDADKDCAGAVERFGDVEHVWKFSSNKRFVVQFYAINDAIGAHTELCANPKLRVSFFPDLCEMDEQGRDVLKKSAAWYDHRVNSWRPAPRIVTTAPTKKRVVKTPPTSTGPSRRPTSIDPHASEPTPISVPVMTNDIQKFYLGQVMNSLTGIPVSHLLEKFKSIQAGTETEAKRDGKGTVMSWIFDHTSANQYYYFPTGPYKESMFDPAKVTSSAGKVVAAPLAHAPTNVLKQDASTSDQKRRGWKKASEAKSNVKLGTPTEKEVAVSPPANVHAEVSEPLGPPIALDMQKWYLRQVVRSITGAIGLDRTRRLTKSASKASKGNNDDDDSILSFVFDTSALAEYSDEARDFRKRQAKLAYLGVEMPTPTPKETPSPPSACQAFPVSAVEQESTTGQTPKMTRTQRRGERVERLIQTRRAAKAERKTTTSVYISATAARPIPPLKDISSPSAGRAAPVSAEQEGPPGHPGKTARNRRRRERRIKVKHAAKAERNAAASVNTLTTAPTGPTATQDAAQIGTGPSATKVPVMLGILETETALKTSEKRKIRPSKNARQRHRRKSAIASASARWREIANLPQPQDVTEENDPAVAKRLDAIVGLQMPHKVASQGLPGISSAGNETSAAKTHFADDTAVQSGG